MLKYGIAFFGACEIQGKSPEAIHRSRYFLANGIAGRGNFTIIGTIKSHKHDLENDAGCSSQ